MQERHDQSRARRAQRVAQGNSAAIDVDPIPIPIEGFAVGDDLGSKAAVRYGARSYQLNPQLELVADVRAFDAALVRSRGATGDALTQALSKALDLYRGPLLAEAAWQWLDAVRLDYLGRYVSAALQLADVVAPVDMARSDGLAEAVLAIAPETDMAYERLIQNARRARDGNALRRLVRRYEQAAHKYGFVVNPRLTDEQGGGGGARASR